MAKLCPHKYYEGPANAGEERLFRFLEVNLPNDYYIVPNGEYPSINAKGGVEYWEYDCIVVAPHAIYHLETRTGRAGLRVTTTLGLSTTMSLRTPSRPPVSNPRYWWPT